MLGLTQSELSLISAGAGLQIGASDAGPITVTSSIGLSGGTNTLELVSGDTVSEDAFDTLTCQNLSVVAGGTACLVQANFVPGTFADKETASGAGVQFLDSVGFTVGIVPGDDNVIGAAGVTTIDSPVSLLSSTGSISLGQAVSAGDGTMPTEVVRLNAAGAVNQVSQQFGKITGHDLAVDANGPVDLREIPNTVGGIFAAQDTAAGAAVMFKDTAGFTVGQLFAGNGANGAKGVVTANADIDLVSTPGPLVLAQPVYAGTATVRLDTGGPALQTTGGLGAITAQNLAVVGGGLADLAEVANIVTGNLAAVESTAGTAVRFLDASGFTVGSVAADVSAPGPPES